MMKIYRNVSNKYRKTKNTKVSYIFLKMLDFPMVYSMCSHKYNLKDQLNY